MLVLIMIEKTLAIIKPDVTRRKLTGACISIIERAFTIDFMKYTTLTRDQAAEFYAEHKDRPWFEEFLGDMINGPVVIMVLSGENAISKWRDLMGATDPKNAAPDTLRYQFGISIGLNSFHGSLTPEDAKKEIAQLCA